MKRWIAGAAVVAGLGIFGGVAVAQQEARQPAQNQQQEGPKQDCDRQEGQDASGGSEA